MIRYLKRKDLNETKYNACIENSVQSNIYGFSWYLDIVADNWDALVLDDYKAVMPIPWRKKYGVRYVYPPFWLLELGVFSAVKLIDESEFYTVLFKNFKLVELRLNTSNLYFKSDYFIDREMQYLLLEKDYKSIYSNYNRNRKREVVKAIKNKLLEIWDDSPEKLIQLFKENIADRIKNISEKDFVVLNNLMKTLIENKKGELLTIYDSRKKIMAAAFFIKYKNQVTQLVCASDIKNRKNGAHTFFNDRAIFKYQPHFEVYNFGGSSMKNIANYYKSFGAETKYYQQIKYNNLPFLFKLFKK